eukprot:5260068-Amphidinium_carterae.1
MNRLLRSVAKTCQLYQLQLNLDKSQLLVTNPIGAAVTCPNGQHVVPAKSLSVYRFLQLFWRQSNASIPWKLTVFNAIVFYTLETLDLTFSQHRLLDAFVYKSLRKIFRTPSTNGDRTQTNELVLQRARAILSITRGT